MRQNSPLPHNYNSILYVLPYESFGRVILLERKNQYSCLNFIREQVLCMGAHDFPPVRMLATGAEREIKESAAQNRSACPDARYRRPARRYFCEDVYPAKVRAAKLPGKCNPPEPS